MSVFFMLFSPRYILLTLAVVVTVLGLLAISSDISWLPYLSVPVVISGGLALLGLRDLTQTRHAILRNYPIAAHLRFLLEDIRPEMRQYFFEGEKDGRPFSRDQRALVYQRAKKTLDKRPFGTMFDVYEESYEWLTHSIQPCQPEQDHFRVQVGGSKCTQPYSASVLNISGMSFGAISPNAIRALNKGANAGGFAHNTGEGSISIYHQEFGGDIIWQIGSGYFGCRTEDGNFCPDRFAENAKLPQVKMIEIKLSQGAKPGHGGVLPAAKINAEIAKTRGIKEGEDCVSPANHKAFSTPRELLEFVDRLRDLSGGKPVGFKLCIGHPWEFLSICKAMAETKMAPDFITVDGKEGGTGAAPQEFMDHIGMPLRDGLNFVHNALVGIEMRDQIRIAASGRIISAFDIARVMGLGADWCNAARGFMFAVGCIQAQACHTDECPTGVTSQDPTRQRAIVVPDKAVRVENFHRATMRALAELVGSAGLQHPSGLTPHHFYKRISQKEFVTFAKLHPPLAHGELLRGTSNPKYKEHWDACSADHFGMQPPMIPVAAAAE
ncbi:MAG: FMN-binding glutamate synthase family protein [Pseudomonadota bacterium]